MHQRFHFPVGYETSSDNSGNVDGKSSARAPPVDAQFEAGAVYFPVGYENSSDSSGKVDGKSSASAPPVDAPFEAGSALQCAAFGDERSVRAPLALVAPTNALIDVAVRDGCALMASNAGRDRLSRNSK